MLFKRVDLMKAIIPILLVNLFAVVGAVHAQNEGEFGLVISDVRTNPTITNITIGGESFPEMCPSRNCIINYGPSPYVTTPTPHNQYMSYSVDFDVIDKATQNEIGPKKKAFLEKFSSSLFACKINDIVEDNNQEVYFCSDTSSVSRDFDSKSWQFDSAGIYDAKSDTMTFVGNLTSK